MGPEERFMKTLNFEVTDTIPIFDIINNREIFFQIISGDEDTQEVVTPSIAARSYAALKVDATRGYYRPDWQVGVVQGWIKHLKAPEKGWKVDVNEETSWISERPYKNLEDVKKHMPAYPDEKEIENDFVEAFKTKRDIFSPDVLFLGGVGGFLDLSYRFLGYELFCEGIYEDPDLISEILNIFVASQRIYSKLYAKHRLGPAYVYCDDIAYSTSLLFSPRFLDTYYFPRLPEIFLPAQEQGIKVIFHSDGDLNLILDRLVDCGIDGLNPLEKLAQMDIVEVRRKWPRLPLVGGIDCSQLLAFGTRDDIEKEVKRIISSVGKEGGLILGSTSEIHSRISLDNCRFLYDTIKEYGSNIN